MNNQVSTDTKQQAEEPLYFECPVLKVKLKSTACEQARNVKNTSLQDAATKRCYKCKDFEEHQKINRVSVAEYHAQIMATTDLSNTGKQYVRHWRNVGKN